MIPLILGDKGRVYYVYDKRQYASVIPFQFITRNVVTEGNQVITELDVEPACYATVDNSINVLFLVSLETRTLKLITLVNTENYPVSSVIEVEEVGEVVQIVNNWNRIREILILNRQGNVYSMFLHQDFNNENRGRNTVTVKLPDGLLFKCSHLNFLPPITKLTDFVDYAEVSDKRKLTVFAITTNKQLIETSRIVDYAKNEFSDFSPYEVAFPSHVDDVFVNTCESVHIIDSNGNVYLFVSEYDSSPTCFSVSEMEFNNRQFLKICDHPSSGNNFCYNQDSLLYLNDEGKLHIVMSEECMRITTESGGVLDENIKPGSHYQIATDLSFNWIHCETETIECHLGSGNVLYLYGTDYPDDQDRFPFINVPEVIHSFDNCTRIYMTKLPSRVSVKNARR